MEQFMMTEQAWRNRCAGTAVQKLRGAPGRWSDRAMKPFDYRAFSLINPMKGSKV